MFIRFFNRTGLHEISYYFHSKVPFLFNKRGLIDTAFLIVLIVLRYSRGVLDDDSRNNDHDIDKKLEISMIDSSASSYACSLLFF